MSRFRPNRPDPRTDSGAAAVEFAIVVPVLLLLVFGIITFGIIFSQQLTLNNAAREGARKAIVNEVSASRTCDGIRRSVQDAIAGIGMTATNVQVKITQDGWSDGNACGNTFVSSFTGAAAARIPCRGSYNVSTGSRDLIVEARYVSSLPAAFPPLPRTITLTSKAVYRCEFSF
jgi:Flp pilus assembly protein TadG